MSRKKACQTILGILDDSEKGDISKIDIENVIARHRNLAANRIPPVTLIAYESRCRTAVKDFIEYVNNPQGWKPSGKQISSDKYQNKGTYD